PTPKPRSALRRGIAGTAAALTLLAVASWHFSPRVEKRSSGLGGLLEEFQLLDAWQMLSGGNPFKYICPMTVFQRMAAVALVGKAAEGDCCTTYDSVPMLWPYQYPECGKSHCPSCWRADGDLASSDVASYAALSFAASLAVSSPKVLLPEAPEEARRLDDVTRHAGIASKQMLARAKHGMRERVVNLCPRISDWEEYFLNDDAENVHARVYKSASAQVAVVSFRGTQAKSAQNWEIDSDINMLNVQLGAPGPHGPAPSEVNIHEGFYLELQRVLPHVRKWVEGYIEGTQGLFGIPSYWKLVFTGHSLGAALAILAATMAEAESWPRLPDAVIAFAAPRVGDKGLSQWWESRDLCKKLLRVSVYNDVITYMPFMEPLQLMDTFNYCFQNVIQCLGQLASGPKALHPSERWTHVCPSSELYVPGAMKGVNSKMEDFSLMGGALAHFIGNALFGYSFGVLNSDIPRHDAYCGLRKELLPAASCTTMEELDEVVCFGLAHDVNATSAAHCRQNCCDDEYCSVWQVMRNNQCWRGRSHHCTALHPYAAEVASGQRLH
ncbi:LIP, partial [Symbiodinium sp. CCMP2456]